MRNVRRMLPVLLVCVFLVAGCGKGQSTPRATLEKLVDAMKNGDKAEIVECFDADGEQSVLVESTADMLVALKELDDACTGEFGDSWDSVTQGPGRNPFKDVNADDAEITVDGDKATAKFPTRRGAMNLVRKDGVWRIATDDMPIGKDLADATRMVKAMTDVMNQVTADVEAGKLKQDDVEKQLTARIMQIMRGEMKNTKQ